MADSFVLSLHLGERAVLPAAQACGLPMAVWADLEAGKLHFRSVD